MAREQLGEQRTGEFSVPGGKAQRPGLSHRGHLVIPALHGPDGLGDVHPWRKVLMGH